MPPIGSAGSAPQGDPATAARPESVAASDRSPYAVDFLTGWRFAEEPPAEAGTHLHRPKKRARRMPSCRRARGRERQLSAFCQSQAPANPRFTESIRGLARRTGGQLARPRQVSSAVRRGTPVAASGLSIRGYTTHTAPIGRVAREQRPHQRGVPTRSPRSRAGPMARPTPPPQGAHALPGWRTGCAPSLLLKGAMPRRPEFGGWSSRYWRLPSWRFRSRKSRLALVPPPTPGRRRSARRV